MKFQYLVTPNLYYFKLSGACMAVLDESDYDKMAKAGIHFCSTLDKMLEKHIELMSEVIEGYEMIPESLYGSEYTLCFHLGQFIYLDDRGRSIGFYEEYGLECRTLEMLIQALVEFEL